MSNLETNEMSIERSVMDTIFRDAVSSQNYKKVQQLIGQGVDVNATDPSNGRTPLHLAATKLDYRMIVS